MTPLDAEAARQQALLAALSAPDAGQNVAGLTGPGDRARSGLRIYRANADALAERALRAAFPTLQALLGPQDFEHMAREFRCANPPQRGDIGAWGAGLPDWLRAHAGLAQWPYLGDCAQLDWMLHCCERAADGQLDSASLALLESHDPQQLALVMMPGVAVLASSWPVASVHAAHQGDGRGFDALRDAIAARNATPCGETVLVARRGWRGVVHTIDSATASWTEEVLRPVSLADALARAGPGFDFKAWLSHALTQEWLQGVVTRHE
ncbi:MAG: DNA-binding domain-containing protein [Burkholderiaceae bacterium]